MMTRAEHLEWATARALQYVEMGDLHQAFASMGTDLNKHPELVNHPGMELGMMQLLSGGLSTPAEMRAFLQGFH